MSPLWFFVYLALLFVAYDLLKMWRRTAAREFDGVRSALALEQGSGAEIEASRLAALPAGARRLIEASSAAGPPREWRRLELEMWGTFRLAPNRPPIPFTARQVLVPLGGFLWEAEMGQRARSRLSGGDYYLDGRAAVRFWIVGLVPVAQASGADVVRSAAGRLLGESLLLPVGLMPERGAAWSEREDGTLELEAAIDGDGEPLRATVRVDGEGRAAAVEMVRRRGAGGGLAAGDVAFRAELQEYTAFGAVMVPRRVRAMWCDDPAAPYVFFDATITSARVA